eukprot:scaffold49975_cov27-Tisochrysis_lutea.AAC.1
MEHDDDDSDGAECEAFFRALEERHGGPISYQTLREWDLNDSSADEIALQAALDVLPAAARPALTASLEFKPGAATCQADAPVGRLALPQPAGTTSLAIEDELHQVLHSSTFSFSDIANATDIAAPIKAGTIVASVSRGADVADAPEGAQAYPMYGDSLQAKDMDGKAATANLDEELQRALDASGSGRSSSRVAPSEFNADAPPSSGWLTPSAPKSSGAMRPHEGTMELSSPSSPSQEQGLADMLSTPDEPLLEPGLASRHVTVELADGSSVGTVATQETEQRSQVTVPAGQYSNVKGGDADAEKRKDARSGSGLRTETTASRLLHRPATPLPFEYGADSQPGMREGAGSLTLMGCSPRSSRAYCNLGHSPSAQLPREETPMDAKPEHAYQSPLPRPTADPRTGKAPVCAASMSSNAPMGCAKPPIQEEQQALTCSPSNRGDLSSPMSETHTAPSDRTIRMDTRRLARQMSEMNKQYRRERDEWRSERESLKAQLAAAQATGSVRSHVMAGGSLAELELSSEDLSKLEREIHEQEALLAGYQRENERLSDELRAAVAERRKADEKHQTELARLHAEMFSYREGVHRAEHAHEAQHSLVEQAEARAARVEAEAAERERDLKFELDRLRAAKKELEGKLAGVDLGKMESEASALTLAREAMEGERAAHQKELAAVSSKLAWYVENQRLIGEAEDELAALRERVKLLEERNQAHAISTESTMGPAAKMRGAENSSLEGSASTNAPEPEAQASLTATSSSTGNVSNVRAHARVAALEKQVSHLTELLHRSAATAAASRSGANVGAAGRNGAAAAAASPHTRIRRAGGRGDKTPTPVGLAELLAAVGPTAAEAEERDRLAARVAELEIECEQAAAAADRRLRSLRQQHDRVAAGYERRVEALSKQLKEAEAAAAAKGNVGAARVRVRELEKQVEDVRAFYVRKVKELESKLADAEAKQAKRKDNKQLRPPPTRTPVLHERLAARLGVAPAAIEEVSSVADAPAKDDLRVEGISVPSDVTGEAVFVAGPAETIDVPASGDVYHKAEGQDEIGGACVSASWLSDEATVLAHQRATAAMAERLEELANEALEAGNALAQTLDVAADGYALADAPTQLQLMLLRDQMRTLELRQQRRAHEAALLLEDARRLAAAEVARVKREMAVEIEGKEALLETFRREMDAIVGEMGELYEQQLREEQRDADPHASRARRHQTSRTSARPLRR